MAGYLPNPAHPDTLRWLRWLVAQGNAPLPGARQEARTAGITKTAMAKALRVSPRALTHWLADPDDPLTAHDFRQMPDKVAAMANALIEDRLDRLREMRGQFDKQDHVLPVDHWHLDQYRPPDLDIPLQQFRYGVQQYLKGGRYAPSEIFTVSLAGLNDAGLNSAEIWAVVASYHHHLKSERPRRDWDISFLAHIETQEYFTDAGPDKYEVAKTIRGRSFMYMNIPSDPSEKKFIGKRFLDTNAKIADLRRFMLREYGGRIRKLESVSFIPYKLKTSKKVAQRKRATGK